MTLRSWVLLGLLATASPAVAEGPRMVSGLKNPEAAAVGPGGAVYVTMSGDRGATGDGTVAIVAPSGKVTTFAKGLDDPTGLVFARGSLYVADVKKVWKIDVRGKPEVFLAPEDFPRKPRSLNDIAQDGLGNLYVSDSGDRAGKLAAVFRVDSRKRVTQVLDGEITSPRIGVPGGLLVDDPDHLLVTDLGLGYVYRYDLITGTAQRLGGGFGGADGLAREPGGRLFVGDSKNGRIYQVVSDFEPPGLLSDKFQAPAGLSVTPDGKTLLVPDRKAGTLTWLPIR